MYEEIKHVADKVLELSNEALKYDLKKEKLISENASKEELEEYEIKIKELLRKIKKDLPLIKDKIKTTPVLESKNNKSKILQKKVGEHLTPINKKKLLSEINIPEEKLKEFAKKIKNSKQKGKKQKFTVYKSSKYAKLSNLFMEKFTFSLLKKYPDLFKSLFNSMNSANIRIFSRSYVDIMLFSSLLAMPITVLIMFFATSNPLLSLAAGIFAMPLIFAIIYMYPASIVNTRKREIKRELVFAIIHMAAIAGSGVKPSKIFELLIESKEYKELEKEFKRILNYTNLFGYSLSTSLKAVSETTPSPEFKELINGMISTIETGGSIDKYLKNKADETLGRFDLDQKKYLETIATYSDVYTGLLIAAPLLFIVTLSILEKISPDLGGLAISTLASIGVFAVVPIMNIMFILFLEMRKEEI
jgi:archaeal flagellar protein FlaJ